MYSLSGGRWPARKRATSDPTPVNLEKTEGREGPPLPPFVQCWERQPDFGESRDGPGRTRNGYELIVPVWESGGKVGWADRAARFNVGGGDHPQPVDGASPAAA